MSYHRGRRANRKALVVADAREILLRAAEGGAFREIKFAVRAGMSAERAELHAAEFASRILGRTVGVEDLSGRAALVDQRFWDAVLGDDE